MRKFYRYLLHGEDCKEEEDMKESSEFVVQHDRKQNEIQDVIVKVFEDDGLLELSK